MDGRRAKGAARRRQLVEATLRVIARDGVAGLTHRAVAEEAGVALASASYHFTGIDDLLATALAHATDELAATLTQGADRSLARLARVLADEERDHHGRFIAGYELYLLAVRRPELRARSLAWLDVLADTFAPDLDGAARSAFQATVEGVCLHALLRDRPPTADEIEAMLRLAWPRD